MNRKRIRINFRKLIAMGMAGLIFILSGTVSAASAENTEETPSGIAYTDLEREIDKYIDVRKETTSAVSASYFNESENISSVVYGKANAKEDIEADEETVYEWGSISKILIWISVM